MGQTESLGVEIWQNALWAMRELGTNGDGHPSDLPIPGLPPGSTSAFTPYTRDQITVAAMLKASRSGSNITLPLSNAKDNCIQVTPGRFGLAEPPTQADADAAAAMLNWVAPYTHPANIVPADFTFDRSFLEAFGSYALTAESNVRYAASLWGNLSHRKKGADGASDVVEKVNPKIRVYSEDLL